MIGHIGTCFKLGLKKYFVIFHYNVPLELELS